MNDVFFNRNLYIFIKSVFFNLFISKILRLCSISQFLIFNFNSNSDISDDVIIKANIHDVIFKSFIIFINRHNSIFWNFMNISLIFSQFFNLIRLFFQYFELFFKVFFNNLSSFLNFSASFWINVKSSFFFSAFSICTFRVLKRFNQFSVYVSSKRVSFNFFKT